MVVDVEMMIFWSWQESVKTYIRRLQLKDYRDRFNHNLSFYDPLLKAFEGLHTPNMYDVQDAVRW